MSLRLPKFVLLGALGALLFVPASAEIIYKWQDELGQYHYSDVPHEGAEEIELDAPQTFSLPSKPSGPNPSTEAVDGAPAGYSDFAIRSPSMEETFWNTAGEVNLVISLRPGLMTGHRIVVFLDGKPKGEMPSGTSSMQLSNLSRGEHTVTAEVREQSGTLVKRATPVRFFMKQAVAEDNPRATPVPPIALPTQPVSRSQLPPASRRKTVR